MEPYKYDGSIDRLSYSTITSWCGDTTDKTKYEISYTAHSFKNGNLVASDEEITDLGTIEKNDPVHIRLGEHDYLIPAFITYVLTKEAVTDDRNIAINNALSVVLPEFERLSLSKLKWLSKADEATEVTESVIGNIVRNGNKIEYTNPSGTLIKWEEQLEQGISSSIASKKASSELGDIVEGKVGEFVNSQKKVEGFNQIYKDVNNQIVAELDVITADEIIECKRNISLARNKFTLDKQAGSIANPESAEFVNPYNKHKILYVDEPLSLNASGDIFPSDKKYIDELKANGIDFANSLQELKKLLK